MTADSAAVIVSDPDGMPRVEGLAVASTHQSDRPAREVEQGRLIRNLQALRALAALMVMVVHLGPLLATAGLPVKAEFLGAGVDVFFVISGFIMVHISRDRPPTAAQFLRSRIIRIVPSYWLVSFAFVTAAFAMGNWQADAAGWAQLARSLFFVPGGEAPFFFPLLYVGWTLNMEVYFYLTYAVALMFGLRQKGRIALVVVLLSMPVAANAVLAASGSLLLFYGNLIVYEFVAGMVLGAAWPLLGRIPLGLGWSALCGSVVLLLLHEWIGGSVGRILGLGLPAVLIVGGALVAERHGATLKSRSVALLGSASYVLYLSHPMVISLFNNASRHIPLLQGGIYAAVTLLGAIMASLSVAVMIHVWFELPAARYLRSRHS